MTEAEKQAIDNFKFFNEGDYITREMEENKDVVLNLIEKQQKEIKEAYWKGYTARDTEAQSICKSCEYKAEINALQMEHNHDVKMIDEVKGEAVRLYKIIDEMASFIEVFELDEEISKTYCDGTLENCKHKEEQGTCKSCIKEYFKKKVQKT